MVNYKMFFHKKIIIIIKKINKINNYKNNVKNIKSYNKFKLNRLIKQKTIQI